MTAQLDRAPMTALIVQTLAAISMGTGTAAVGYAAAPTVPHGWQGEPNDTSATFIPYLVVMPLTAAAGSGPIGDPQSEWQLPYQIQSYAISGAMVEAVADRARGALGALTHTSVNLGVNYRIQQVWSTQIGGIIRQDQTDPPYFAQADMVTVWLSKRST